MTQIFAVGGGKGGSGKSFISANLGVMLAKQGKKVVLVDLDLGAPNLHTMMGLNNIKTGLNNFLNKSVKNLSLTAVPTKIPNLYIISSIGCSLEVGNLFYAQKQKIIRSIWQLPADYVVLDLGAGTTYNTVDFFLASHQGLSIFTPEPTSIQNTVQFIKAVYLRKLKHILKQHAFSIAVKEVGDEADDGVVRSPLDIVDSVMRSDPARAKVLQKELRKLKFKLILNQYRKHIDETLGNKIEKVCNRHFYSQFQFLGNIAYNERVHESIIARKIFVAKYPYTPTSTDLKNVGNKMAGSNAQAPTLKETNVKV
ncbi:MAG: P-loop NTPase [Deltaproteobacteria bacterium]|nr:P-loop NTPase [Deltaproteobacteria bacterium]